jgi:molybdate transport system substrate-binding protein
MPEAKDSCVKAAKGPILPVTKTDQTIQVKEEGLKMIARVGKPAPDFEAGTYIKGGLATPYDALRRNKQLEAKLPWWTQGKLIVKLFILILIVLACPIAQNAIASPRPILIFAGAASKPATEELIKVFQEKMKTPVEINFGGSGFVLSQMKLSKKGDLYFPGSSDFMELAKREGLVFPESEKIVVYLVPAINVQKGNPKGIRSLKDLTKAGLRVAIANPETVCVGTYAVEIIERNFTPLEKERFKKNLVNYTESCEKTANAISLKAVDAVIGWRVFQYWDPERIETIYLKPEEVPRIGCIPIAISKFSQDKMSAQKFIDFLLSPQGKATFRKYHYLMDLKEAIHYVKPNTPVGGEYSLPKEWRAKGSGNLR